MTFASVRSTYLARTHGESMEAKRQTKGKLRKYLDSTGVLNSYLYILNTYIANLFSYFMVDLTQSTCLNRSIVDSAQDGDTHHGDLATELQNRWLFSWYLVFGYQKMWYFYVFLCVGFHFGSHVPTLRIQWLTVIQVIHMQVVFCLTVIFSSACDPIQLLIFWRSKRVLLPSSLPTQSRRRNVPWR